MPTPGAMFCTRCDYPLSGLPTGPCPECASPFDPGIPRTFRKHPRLSRAASVRRWAFAVFGLVALVVFFPRGCNRTISTNICPTCSASTSWTAVTVNAPRWLTPFYASFSWRSGSKPCTHAELPVAVTMTHDSLRLVPFRRATSTGNFFMNLMDGWPEPATAADDHDEFVRTSALNSVRLGSKLDGFASTGGDFPQKIMDRLQANTRQSAPAVPIVREPPSSR